MLPLSRCSCEQAHYTHPTPAKEAGGRPGLCPGAPSRRGEPADPPAEARLGAHAFVRGRNPGSGARYVPVPKAPEPPAGKKVSVPCAPGGAESAKPGGESRGAALPVRGPLPAAPLPSPELLMRYDGRFSNSET